VLFVDDDGLHGRELFTLRYFNAPPSFLGGGTVLARDDDGLTTIEWATAISAGAPDESAQRLSFEVVVDQPQLFMEQPRIDAAGNLTFRPKPNVQGTASIRVTLRDDGGTIAGGIDASQPQVFSLQVDKPFPWHNTLNPLDIAGAAEPGDGAVTPSHALAIINYINAFGSGPVPPGAVPGPPYIDTASAQGGALTGDNFISPHDVLAVVNWINAFGNGVAGPGGEGEASAAPHSSSAASESDWFSLLAFDVALQPKRRSGGHFQA
jgi:hypothetical protein